MRRRVFSVGNQDFGLQQQRGWIGGRHLQGSLHHLFGFARVAAVEQALPIGEVRFRGVALLPHHVIELGQAHLHPWVFRLHFQQAMQHLDGLGPAVGFQVRFGDLQEQRPRFAQHALLHVKVGQLLEWIDLIRGQLGDLFINRDGLAVESVGQIHLRQPFEVFERMGHVTLAGVEVAHRHQGGLISRIVTQDLLILGDGLVDLALVQILQSALERFALIEGHL